MLQQRKGHLFGKTVNIHQLISSGKYKTKCTLWCADAYYYFMFFFLIMVFMRPPNHMYILKSSKNIDWYDVRLSLWNVCMLGLLTQHTDKHTGNTHLLFSKSENTLDSFFPLQLNILTWISCGHISVLDATLTLFPSQKQKTVRAVRREKRAVRQKLKTHTLSADNLSKCWGGCEAQSCLSYLAKRRRRGGDSWSSAETLNWMTDCWLTDRTRSHALS